MTDKSNTLNSFAFQRTEVHETLMFAKRVQADLKALAQAIATGYQAAGKAPSTGVEQGLMQILLLADGNARFGTVVNPPVMSLTDLITQARVEITAGRGTTPMPVGVPSPAALARIERDLDGMEEGMASAAAAPAATPSYDDREALIHVSTSFMDRLNRKKAASGSPAPEAPIPA